MIALGHELLDTPVKPASAVTDAPQSVRETDYLDNIAQIQKAWERELQTRRDELTVQAGEIEELTIEASAKNIEISRYIILWT